MNFDEADNIGFGISSLCKVGGLVYNKFGLILLYLSLAISTPVRNPYHPPWLQHQSNSTGNRHPIGYVIQKYIRLQGYYGAKFRKLFRIPLQIRVINHQIWNTLYKNMADDFIWTVIFSVALIV